MTLVNQPTLAPTRKIAAVGWTSLLGPVVAAIIAPWLPGMSEACGGEVGISLVASSLALAQGLLSLSVGYLIKEDIKYQRSEDPSNTSNKDKPKTD
jgi:hypothetical protein